MSGPINASPNSQMTAQDTSGRANLEKNRRCPMIRQPQQQIEQCQQDGYLPGWNVKRPAEVQEIQIRDEKRRKK